MPRSRNPTGHVRAEIAQLAARLMAEDGVDDFGVAKRKAAERSGAMSTRALLPSNEEVEHALREYLNLFHRDEHEERTAHLRRCAVRMMQMFENFNPRLTGAVLNGHPGRHSSIDIFLFADNVKDVEIFLLGRRFDYRLGERKVLRDNVEMTAATYFVITEEADYNLTIFSGAALRQSIRTEKNGRVLCHAGLEEVSAMLQEHSS